MKSNEESQEIVQEKKIASLPQDGEMYYLEQLELILTRFPHLAENISLHIAPANSTPEDEVLKDLPEEERKLVNQIKDKCGDIFVKAAEYQKENVVEFLIKCRVDVNYKGENDCSAADHSLTNKNYKILLLLLKNDSFFPTKFRVSDLSEDCDDEKEIKSLVEVRNHLHEIIENKEVEDVKKIKLNENLKLYLNGANESAVYTALKNKKWNTYAYLKSVGAEFANSSEERELNELPNIVKKALQEAMIKYFPSVPNAHILYLMSKSRSQKPVANLTDVVMGYYKELDKIPEVSIILKTVQFADYLDIIFDFDEVNIAKVNPVATKDVKGEAMYKDGRIYIAAGSKRRQKEILGTVAHELTHMAMQILYENDCNPYVKSDKSSVDFFQEFKSSLQKNVNKNLLGPSKILLDALHNYKPSDHDSELIVRIPQILVQCNSGRDWLEKTTPKFLKFYSTNIYPKCEEFIGTSVILKPKNTIKSINESLGDMIKLKSSQIFFKNSDSVRDLLKKNSNFILYKVKNTLLGVLKILQGIFGKDFNSYHSNCLVLKFKNFAAELKEIIEGFYPDACDKMVLEMDDNPCDDDIFEAFDFLSSLIPEKPKKKIIFVIPDNSTKLVKIIKKNHLIDFWEEMLDDEFSLNHLDDESQMKILRKKIWFQGRRTVLRNLIQNKNLYSCITPEVLCTLLENGCVNIGNEILGLTSLEGAYSDMVLPINFESLITEIENSEDKFIIRSVEGQESENDFCEHFKETWINAEYLNNKVYNFKSKIFKEKVVLVNNRFRNSDFRDICKSNWDKRCYFIDVENLESNSFLLQHIYNPNFYVERKVKKILLKAGEVNELFGENNSDIFLISSESSGGNTFETYQNVKWLSKKDAKSTFKILREQGNTVHLIQTENEKFIWKDSYGSVAKIRKYIGEYDNNSLDEENLMLDIIHKEIVLIADDPGMGKSTTITKLYESKRIVDTHWIIRINLKDCLKAIRDHIKEISIKNIIRLLQDILPNLKNELHESLLTIALRDNEFPKCLLFVFDGFDEMLDQDDREKIHNLLNFLKNKTSSKIWITTRLQYKEDLETALETFAIRFDPFDKETKNIFVRKYLKDRLKLILSQKLYSDVFSEKNNSKLLTFSEKLLLKMEDIFNDNIAQFIGTPLQLNFAMFDSIQYFIKWLDSGHDLDFTYIGRNLIEVYENFIDRKYEIYFKKFNKIEKDTQGREKITSEKYHRNLAESLIYERKNLKPEVVEKQLILSVGLIQSQVDNFEFIHFTFREYYFAQTFAEYVLKETEGTSEFEKKMMFLFREIFAKQEFEMICHFMNLRLEATVPEKNLTILRNLFLKNRDILEPFTTCDSIFGVVTRRGYKNIFRFIWSVYLSMAEPLSYKITNILNKSIFQNAILSAEPEIWESILEIATNANICRNWENIYYRGLFKDSMPFVIRGKNWELVLSMCLKMDKLFTENEIYQLLLLLFEKYSFHASHLHLGFEIALRKNWDTKVSFLNAKSLFETSAALRSWLNRNVLIMKPETVKLLLLYENYIARSFFHEAVELKNVEIGKLILERSEKILSLEEWHKFLTTTDHEEEDVLHLAIFRDSLDYVKLLIAYGEKHLTGETFLKFLMKKNNMNHSVLQSAIYLRRIEIAQFLINIMKEFSERGIFREPLKMADNSKSDIFNVVMGSTKFPYLSFENFEELLPQDNHWSEPSFTHLADNLEDVLLMIDALEKGQKVSREIFWENLMMEDENGEIFFHLVIRSGVEKAKFLFEVMERELSIEDRRRLILMKGKCQKSIIYELAHCKELEVLKYVLNEVETILSVEEYCEWLITKDECKSTLYGAILTEDCRVVSLILERLDAVEKMFGSGIRTEIEEELFLTPDKNGYNCLLLAIETNEIETTKILINYLKKIFDSEKLSEVFLMKNKNCRNCLQLTHGPKTMSDPYDVLINELSKMLENCQNCLYLTYSPKIMSVLLDELNEILTLDQWCQLLRQKCNSEGNTALHIIASRNIPDLLQLLFEKIEQILPIEIQQILLMETNACGLNILHSVLSSSSYKFGKTPHSVLQEFNLILSKAEEILTKTQQQKFLLCLDKKNRTIVYKVIRFGEAAILDLLLNKSQKMLKPRDFIAVMSMQADYGISEKHFDTLLHKAADKKQPEILGVLLDNINTSFPLIEKRKIIMMKNCRNNNTFLYLFLCHWGRNSFQTKCLFDKLRKILTADDLCTLLTISDRFFGNVFYAAVLNQTKETLKLLFEEAENLLTKNKFQELLTEKAQGFETVLHLALCRGELDVVKLVLNKGLQLLTSKHQIGTLLHTIVDRKYEENEIKKTELQESLLDSLMIFVVLEKSKRSLTTKKFTQLLMATDEYGYTVLQKAVIRNKFETVTTLLQETEKLRKHKDLRKFVMAKTSSGKTALDLASKCKVWPMRPLLIAFIKENQITEDFLEDITQREEEIMDFDPFQSSISVPSLSSCDESEFSHAYKRRKRTYL